MGAKIIVPGCAPSLAGLGEDKIRMARWTDQGTQGSIQVGYLLIVTHQGLRVHLRLSPDHEVLVLSLDKGDTLK